MAVTKVTVAEAETKLTADTKSVDAGFAKVDKHLDNFEKHATQATKKSDGFFSKVAAGGAKLLPVVAGVGALGLGLGKAAQFGLGFNNSMEQVTAKLNAFTKDGAKSAQILDMIRDRAAKTPFAFEEMANATAGLMSSAKGANIPLEKLVENAEILAASHPEQGLEGAAFALREAVGGDFTSIIERFDLPRQMINKLKAEGLPNIEIVKQAMLAMGYDTDLVGNLAETAGGRWSTFKDTLQGLAAIVTKPIFTTFSGELGNLNGLLEKNQPRLEALANTLADRLQRGLDGARSGFSRAATAAQSFYNYVKPIAERLRDTGNIFQNTLLPALRDFKDGKFDEAANKFASGLGGIKNAASDIQAQGLPKTLTDLASQLDPATTALAAGFAGVLVAALTKSNVAGLIVSTIGPLLIQAGGQLGPSLFKWVEDTAQELPGKLATWLARGTDWLINVGGPALIAAGSTLSQALATFVEQSWPLVQAALVTFIQRVGDWILQVGLPALVVKASQLKDSVLQWIRDAADAMPGELDKFRERVDHWFEENNPKMAERQEKSFDGLKQGMDNTFDELDKMPGNLDRILREMEDFVSKFFNDIIAAMSGSTQNVADGMVAGFMSAVQALPGILAEFLARFIAWAIRMNLVIGEALIRWTQGFIEGLAKLVVLGLAKFQEFGIAIGKWFQAKIGELYAQGLALGGNIVAGIQQGISAQWGKLLGWVHARIMELPEAVRKALGIGSPSKVLAADARGIPDGIIMGIEERKPALMDTVKRLALDLIGQLRNAFDAINHMGSTAFTAPTGDTLDAFFNSLDAVTARLRDRLSLWWGRFSEATGRVAEGVGQSIAGIVRAFQPINEMGENKFTAPTVEAIDTFLNVLDVLVARMQDRITLWWGRWNETTAKIATAVGEGASGILRALEPLSRLGESKIVGASQESIDALFDGLDRVTVMLQDRISLWWGRWNESTAKVAAGVGDTVSNILRAVDPLTKLASFIKAPTQQGMIDFFEALDFFLEEFNRRASDFSTQASPIVAELGTNIGKIAEGVGKALDPITKMAAAQAVTREQIEGAFSNLWYALHQLGEVMKSGELQGDALDRLNEFSVAIGGIFANLKVAFEQFTDKTNTESIVKIWIDGLGKMFQNVKEAWGPQVEDQFKFWLQRYRDLFRDFVEDVNTLWLNLPTGPTGDGYTPSGYTPPGDTWKPPGFRVPGVPGGPPAIVQNFYNSVVADGQVVATLPENSHMTLVRRGQRNAMLNPGRLGNT